VDTPTYNSEGQAIWKPQPGEYFPNGLRYAHSYGGIVSALQDLQAAQGSDVKTYPNNFAGIIAAIEDLMKFLVAGELPDVGAPPPGWEIIVKPDGSVDGDWQVKPQDGKLWFDTRQGRLFIAINGEYVQTNGADGISHVGPNAPTTGAVIGQHWLDTDTGLFYVYIGEGIWQAVVSDGDITITTASLPLAIARTTAATADYTPTIIPELPSLDQMQVQQDYNTWLMAAVVDLDKAVTEAAVSMGEEPPTENVVPGRLWYDTETLELSIYYEDDDSAQWIPTSVAYAIDDQLLPLQTALAEETRLREQAIHNLHLMLENFDVSDNNEILHLGNLITALEAKVDRKPVVDMTGYVTSNDYSTATSQLIERLNSLETATPDYSSLMSKAEADADHAALETVIASKATPADVAAVAAQIPDVSNFLVQQDVVDAIANITTEYLPRTGGVLTGSFQLQKNDYALPSLDFSGASWYSKCAFQFTANAPTPANTKFGTTENLWEYAWEFGADEDFCWIYNDTNKVFSITKEGPACSTLYLGDIGDNTNNGRVIHNKIDLKERLNTYQSAFESIRQAVSSSTDYDSLKSGLLTALANV
jgi:hypothetical protein